MAIKTYFLLLLILFFLPQCKFDGEEEVLCDFMERCILPCSFQPGPNIVVNWKINHEESFISRFHNGQDHGARNENFKGRTSVFVNDIPCGNAALLLKKVRVQDEGEYMCLASTSTNGLKATYVRVRVRAPVVDVYLDVRDTLLLCTSDNIFPRPNVTWSLNLEPAPDSHTSISSSESGLFSVLSSVSLTQTPPYEYICNISTEHRWSSATYRRNAEIRFSESLTVPCTNTSAPVKSLVWKFNHNLTIYSKIVDEQKFSEFYTEFGDDLTVSNGLKLKSLTRDQLGLYSCEVSTLTDTYIIVTRVSETTELSIATIIIIVVVIIIIIALVVVAICQCHNRKGKRKTSEEEEDAEDKEETSLKPVPVSQHDMEEPPLKNLLGHEDSDVGSCSSYASSHNVSERYDESSAGPCRELQRGRGSNF